MESLTVMAMVVYLGLIVCATFLIEATIALLFGYRNKMFLLGIVLVNVPTGYALHYTRLALNVDYGFPYIAYLFGVQLLITITELAVLSVVFRERYSKKELSILVGTMNLISFLVIVIALGSFL